MSCHRSPISSACRSPLIAAVQCIAPAPGSPTRPAGIPRSMHVREFRSFVRYRMSAASGACGASTNRHGFVVRQRRRTARSHNECKRAEDVADRLRGLAGAPQPRGHSGDAVLIEPVDRHPPERGLDVDAQVRLDRLAVRLRTPESLEVLEQRAAGVGNGAVGLGHVAHLVDELAQPLLGLRARETVAVPGLRTGPSRRFARPPSSVTQRPYHEPHFL